MKVYARNLAPAAFVYALEGAKEAGLLTEHAVLTRFDHRPCTRGPFKGGTVFTVTMGATEKAPGEKRHRTHNNDAFALTFAEYGAIIAELYARDPQARIAHFRDARHFRELTGGEFPLPTHVLVS